MRKPVAAVAVLTALTLAGCSNPPQHGVVEHKQHSSAYTYYTYPCISYRKDGSCVIHGTQANHMPATWELCLRADPGDTDHDASGCIEVGEIAWNRFDENDHYPDGGA